MVYNVTGPKMVLFACPKRRVNGLLANMAVVYASKNKTMDQLFKLL